ncbi:MAG: hypothetical protein HXY49_12680 [Ignavibacteriaceae bacterium]|nr:hypothetical protein [Ignavibacteriaceae bacterium]
MNKNVKKIGLVLLILVFLPAAAFFIYQLNSLDENEKVIEEIYNNQLNAILFSINQYSEDVASGWANRIQMIMESDPAALSQLSNFVKETSALNGLFFLDSINSGNLTIVTSPGKKSGLTNETLIKILNSNRNIYQRLLDYTQSGFRKIEPLKNVHTGDNSILVFIAEVRNNKQFFGLLVKPENFVNDVLSPKIQEITEDRFVIHIYNSSRNFTFNTTERFDSGKVQQKKPLWLMPQYYLGINLKGRTIESLVESRSFTNIVLISLMLAVILAGGYIVFRNVKREVELAQLKSDFVSNVSHELRTPLALISMFSETLEMDRVKTEAKKKEYYSIISQETNRLGKIVNTLLNFSRMEAGKRKYNFVKQNINKIINNVFNTYHFHLQNNGFSYHLFLAENIPEIKIDGEALSEAVINLIDNSIKYSSETRDITVRTGFEDGFAFVEVEDKGIGIEDEHQKKIFEKFYRVSSGLVHNTKGSGLGLAIVKHIVDSHNGKIELNSKLNHGTRIKLFFPVNL